MATPITTTPVSDDEDPIFEVRCLIGTPLLRFEKPIQGTGRYTHTAVFFGDADDLFADVKRGRVYVSCGEGFLDVLDARDYRRLARVPTVRGARTSYFVPSMDRLFLAVRAASLEPATVWVYRPVP